MQQIPLASAGPLPRIRDYDPSDAKIGEIMDVLVDRGGKIVALVVGAGGFIGMGEKDVIVPFNAVQFKTKDNNKWYPVMNTTKDALKNAPGYKYDNTHGKSSAVSLDFQGNVIAQ